MKPLRPYFHLTGPSCWINDPNGLVYFKGHYHFFYQCHPFGIEWGPMHWGHAVSDDLLHFEQLPFALTPGDPFDRDGCFSGTSIVVGERLYVFYTGFIRDDDPKKIIQHQCAAYSDDGIHFTKLGLVVGKKELPEIYSINDFRDPCVYQDGDHYCMLVAARKIGGRGHILKFHSTDLLHWTFIKSIMGTESTGIMIECPDYSKELGLVTYCEQLQPSVGYMHMNRHSSFYRVGEFIDDHFESVASGTLDYGFDFYAPQMFKKGNIMFGWMEMWDRNHPSQEYGFAGSLTIGRKLSIVDNVVVQTPVLPPFGEAVEVQSRFEDHMIAGAYHIEIDDLEEFSLVVRGGQNHRTDFHLNGNEWVFDRSASGAAITGLETDEDSKKGIRRMPYVKKEHHDIYVVLDQFSVEIFVDGVPMTSLIYPDEGDDLVSLLVKSSRCIISRCDLQD